MITNAANFPEDEQFHTVTVEHESNSYHVAASNNRIDCIAQVGSVAVAGSGVRDGRLTFDAAETTMTIEYKDFTEEYGYEELEINFEKR